MAQKIWMITGASRGFGAEIAKAVLAAGDKLIATARKVNAIDYLAKNPNVFAVALEVTDEQQAKKAVDAGLKQFGRIDVLVNNAGLWATRCGRGDECAGGRKHLSDERFWSPECNPRCCSLDAQTKVWTHH